MTTTVQAPATTQLAPYIFFYGRCEEALAFYATAFGGQYEVLRLGDSPMREGVPPEVHAKVMHASFTAPGLTFMASDGMCPSGEGQTKSIDPEAGNISLALSASSRTEGERLFRALADGGNVKMPLGDAFWGGTFGLVNDRFGNEWMITTP
jgi:PhnB protein